MMRSSPGLSSRHSHHHFCSSLLQPPTTWHYRSAAPARRPSTTCRASSTATDERIKSQVKEAGLKAAAAASKFAQEATDSAQRTWRKLDNEYQISWKVKDKTQKAFRRLEEQARDVDQTYSVRRRIRNSVEYVQRMWPVWSARLDAFSATWYGKATIILVLVVVISSPIFWSILNFALILWWLAIPIGAALINSAQRRAQEQARAAAEEAARRQNPFADMFRARSQAQGTGAASSRGGAKRSGGYSGPEGPIIDADYVVIVEDDSKQNKRK